ncbi:hypothetical protein Tco_0648723, partial [Tanacetum coccineum]
DIKGALFSMGDDKAPGPDGFIIAFFKKAWNVVGKDVTCAILEFFINDTFHVAMSFINALERLLLIALRMVWVTWSGPPRCAFKVDIQKSYDTVDWHSLDRCCLALVFIIEWWSGLWQGDPLSPYLFTLVMEVLTLIIHRGVANAKDFQHLNYVHVIMKALEDFKNMSNLVPSIPKSTAFFYKVPSAVKASIPSSMPFTEGFLPVRYREVPLISSRLLYRDFKVLLEKLESQASIFILPASIIYDLEQLMRVFLWCQGEMKKGKAKVVWDSVCVPQKEGGLGIHGLEDFNVALIATHIWCIITNKESLWIKWIHSYKLNGRSFWDVPCLGDKS